jgi:heme/copper-type cytochrome/quinol oxidase subunit 1
MYNVVVTTHALTIIFFMVIPTLIGGFGNYLLPLILGIVDLIYPRLNILRWWLLPTALYLIVSSVRSEGGRGTR